MKIKVVGLGGIGTHLVVPLCRYLSRINDEINITLIDGDEFKPENAERQNFTILGNKAWVMAEELKKSFQCLQIEAKSHYVTNENLFLFIKEGDIIFSCVDNHATRKLLSAYCSKLEEVVLISGGNEYTDGNVQIYIRKEGVNITPPLIHFHPEIADPIDRNPAEMSCEELARSGDPQLIFTNFRVAADMLSAFWLIEKNILTYSEQYFDLKTGMTRSVMRNEVILRTKEVINNGTD